MGRLSMLVWGGVLALAELVAFAALGPCSRYGRCANKTAIEALEDRFAARQ